MLAPLLPARALAVDVGAGEGTLLPLLSPIFERVIAIDRSAARLARCAQRVAALGLPNVRLREGTVEDRAGGAGDRAGGRRRSGGAGAGAVPRRAAAGSGGGRRPAAARGRPHRRLSITCPTTTSSLREQGHVWLGFEPARLRDFLETAGLRVVYTTRLSGPPGKREPGPAIDGRTDSVKARRDHMDTRTEFPAFKVKDLSLAELGRKKIRMAEKEMPGLMALREEFGAQSRWRARASPAACT